MEITIETLKYGLAVVTVGGAAAGLNLGVLQLTDPPAEDIVSLVELTSEADTEPAEPLQVVVDIPVVVPDAVLATDEAVPIEVAEAAPSGQGTLAAPVAAPTTAATTSPSTGAAKTAPSKTAPAATDSPTTAAPRTTSAPSTTARPTTTTQAPTTTEAPAATEYLYYEFSGVASQIIVAQHGDGSLEFWSVTTEPGWNYMVEKNSPTEVEVKFSRAPDGEGEAKFELDFEDGHLEVNKER